MMQDGVSPHAVETAIGKGQTIAVSLDEGYADAVGLSAPPGFAKVTC
jgi:hypothetical protein